LVGLGCRSEDLIANSMMLDGAITTALTDQHMVPPTIKNLAAACTEPDVFTNLNTKTPPQRHLEQGNVEVSAIMCRGGCEPHTGPRDRTQLNMSPEGGIALLGIEEMFAGSGVYQTGQLTLGGGSVITLPSSGIQDPLLQASFGFPLRQTTAGVIVVETPINPSTQRRSPGQR
jgi:hypothetical protein